MPDEPTDPQDPSPTSEALGTTLLELVQRVEAPAQVNYANLAVAAERAGVNPPGGDELTVEFFDALRADGAWVGVGNLGASVDQPEAWRTTLGITPPQVAEALGLFSIAFSATFLRPLDPVTVEHIERSALEDPDWGSDLESVETPFGRYLDWNPDDDQALDVTRRGGLRDLGRGGQVGVAGETIVWSAHHEFIEVALSRHAGEGETFATNELLVEILAGYLGPAPQAFFLNTDESSAWLAMNIAEEVGYTATLFIIDPAIAGTAGPEELDGTTSRDGNVIRIDALGPDAFRTLVDCLFTKACVA